MQDALEPGTAYEQPVRLSKPNLNPPYSDSDRWQRALQLKKIFAWKLLCTGLLLPDVLYAHSQRAHTKKPLNKI